MCPGSCCTARCTSGERRASLSEDCPPTPSTPERGKGRDLVAASRFAARERDCNGCPRMSRPCQNLRASREAAHRAPAYRFVPTPPGEEGAPEQRRRRCWRWQWRGAVVGDNVTLVPGARASHRLRLRRRERGKEEEEENLGRGGGRGRERFLFAFFVKQNKQEILPEEEEKEEGGGGELLDTTSSGDAPAERRSQQVRGIPSTDTDSLSNRGQRAATAFPHSPCSAGQRCLPACAR